MLKGALQWSVYPSGPEAYIGAMAAASNQSVLAGTHFTDPERMESWVNFSGKEGHPNIQPSTSPGIKLGTSGLGGRYFNHCANPSATVQGMTSVQNGTRWDGLEWDRAEKYSTVQYKKRRQYRTEHDGTGSIEIGRVSKVQEMMSV